MVTVSGEGAQAAESEGAATETAGSTTSEAKPEFGFGGDVSDGEFGF